MGGLLYVPAALYPGDYPVPTKEEPGWAPHLSGRFGEDNNENSAENQTQDRLVCSLIMRTKLFTLYTKHYTLDPILRNFMGSYTHTQFLDKL